LCDGGGGGRCHGILRAVGGYAMRGAREKTHQIIGGFQKNAREKNLKSP